MTEVKYKCTELYLLRRRKIYFDINFTIRMYLSSVNINIPLPPFFIPFSFLFQQQDKGMIYANDISYCTSIARSFETDLDVIRLTKFRFIMLCAVMSCTAHDRLN